MNTPAVEPPLMDIDREGWWAVQHTAGWWCGTERGIICYEDIEVAKFAMTIRWQMEGGRKLNYRIKKFPGPTVIGDEVMYEKTAEQAIIDYENTIPKNENRAILPKEE